MATPDTVYKLDPTPDSIAATVASNLGHAYAGVDVDAGGDVYVSLKFISAPSTPMPTPNTDAVLKFHETSPGSLVYQNVATISGFTEPNDVVVSNDGVTVYVVDTANDRIRQFIETPTGSNNYVFTRIVVLPGDQIPGRVAWPFQLFWDQANNFYYVTDISRRYQVFDSNWNFRYQCQMYLCNNNSAIGVAVDASQNIYVGMADDADRDQILKMRACAQLPPPFTPTFTPTTSPAVTPGAIPACNDGPLTFYIYPNPVRSGVMKIYYEACYNGNSDIQIYNTASDLVMTNTLAGRVGPNTASLDIHRLATGVYYSQLVLPNAVGGRGRTKTGKFAVVR